MAELELDELELIHPTVLDLTHQVTKLIIQDDDDKLHHAGSNLLLKFVKILNLERKGSSTQTSAELMESKASNSTNIRLRLFKPHLNISIPQE